LQEKIRVYSLARELNVESKDLVDLCRQAGIDVKNQLSSLDAHQRDAVELLIKKGGPGGVAVAAPPKAPSSLIPHRPSRSGRCQACRTSGSGGQADCRYRCAIQGQRDFIGTACGTVPDDIGTRGAQCRAEPGAGS
jgi:hypothetical protein